MTVVSDLSDQSDLSDNAISRIVLMSRERLCARTRDLPNATQKRVPVPFCEQFEQRSRFATGESEGVYVRTRLSERPSKARDLPKCDAKNVKGRFSVQKVEKNGVFDVFQLDKPHFR